MANTSKAEYETRVIDTLRTKRLILRPLQLDDRDSKVTSGWGAPPLALDDLDKKMGNSLLFSVRCT